MSNRSPDDRHDTNLLPSKLKQLLAIASGFVVISQLNLELYLNLEKRV